MVPSGIRFDVTADSVKMTHRYLQPQPGRGNGRSITVEERVQIDGKPHPSSSNWTVVARWLDPYSLELIWTRNGGRPETIHVTYSLSADRKTLTWRWVSSGYIDERIFYR